MQKKQMLIVTMIFLVLGMGAVQAIEEVGSEFLTLRQQAMGGVSVTIARGHSAITNNPAALKFSKPEFKWPRFSAALSNDYQAHTDTLAKLTDMESEVSDQIQHLKDIVPVKIGMQFAANPLISLSGNRFGVGIFGKGRFIGRLYRVSNPKFKFDGYYDSNSAFAYATQINFGLPVSVGVSLRYLERYRVYDKATGEESVDLTTAQILSKVNDTEGDFDYGVVSKYGIFMDVGGIISFNDHKGKMGVVYKNLGSGFKGTKELASGVNQDVDDLLMPSVRVGASYDFDFFNQEYLPGLLKGDLIVAADYELVSANDDIRKNIHMGIEKALLFDTLYLRGGINEGFIVGGIGIDLHVGNFHMFTLNYSKYSEELGEKIGHESIQYDSIELSFLF